MRKIKLSDRVKISDETDDRVKITDETDQEADGRRAKSLTSDQKNEKLTEATEVRTKVHRIL